MRGATVESAKRAASRGRLPDGLAPSGWNLGRPV